MLATTLLAYMVLAADRKSSARAALVMVLLTFHAGALSQQPAPGSSKLGEAPKDDVKSYEQKAATDQRASEKYSVTVNVAPESNAEREPKPEAGKHEQAPTHDWGLIIPTWVLAIATIGLFTFTARLWGSTRTLVLNAEGNAQIELRAYVAMDEISFFVDIFVVRGGLGRGDVAIIKDDLRIKPRNYGATPAFDTSIYYSASATKPSNLAADGPLIGRQMLHPGMVQSYGVASPKHGELFWVWGHFVYRDIYSRWWRTNFWYAHRPENIFVPEAQHNEEKGPYKTEAEALASV